MHHLYKGTVIAVACTLVVGDYRYLNTCLDKAALSNLPFTDCKTYLAAVLEDINSIFGKKFSLSFYDVAFGEPVDEVSGLTDFCLFLSAQDDPYFSKAIH